jgi:hypothetical protein
MALSKLSSAFNLEDVKGYFPHKKNTRANYEANIEEEDFPDPEFFDADFMSPSSRAAFLAWHAEQKKSGKKFHLRPDMLYYCRKDCNVLRFVFMQMILLCALFQLFDYYYTHNPPRI